MKKIKILGFMLMLMMYSLSCEKLPDPAGERGFGIVPGISGLNPAVFDVNDLEHSYVRFTVSLPEGKSLNKATLVASYNNDHADAVIKEITSFPAVVTVTSAEAAQKLGIDLEDIVRGDVFGFELVIDYDGRSTHSTPLAVPVACAYSVAMATGSYHSVSEDWATEGDITLTADPLDPYKIYVSGLEEIDGLVEDRGPLVMHVDPITFAVTADKTVLASLVTWGAPYHNIAYEGTGTFSTCTGTYTMNFTISVDEGSWGANSFVFTKNP